ncbi:MAG: hypothetical protein M1838_000016 [Thelocarpon superellum]|nr:MAG: hypothetical protein M1838_000016 [Thelocarpon superellum]
MKWNGDADRKLLLWILATHTVQLDSAAAAEMISPQCTPRALVEHLKRLRNEAEAYGYGDTAPETPTSQTPVHFGPTRPSKRKAETGALMNTETGPPTNLTGVFPLSGHYVNDDQARAAPGTMMQGVMGDGGAAPFQLGNAPVPDWAQSSDVALGNKARSRMKQFTPLYHQGQINMATPHDPGATTSSTLATENQTSSRTIAPMQSSTVAPDNTTSAPLPMFNWPYVVPRVPTGTSTMPPPASARATAANTEAPSLHLRDKRLHRITPGTTTRQMLVQNQDETDEEASVAKRTKATHATEPSTSTGKLSPFDKKLIATMKEKEDNEEKYEW